MNDEPAVDNETAKLILDILRELNEPVEPAPGLCECGRPLGHD